MPPEVILNDESTWLLSDLDVEQNERPQVTTVTLAGIDETYDLVTEAGEYVAFGHVTRGKI